MRSRIGITTQIEEETKQNIEEDRNTITKMQSITSTRTRSHPTNKMANQHHYKWIFLPRTVQLVLQVPQPLFIYLHKFFSPYLLFIPHFTYIT